MKMKTKKPFVVQWWIFKRAVYTRGKTVWEWWDECASRRDGLKTLKSLRTDAEEPCIWRLGRVEVWQEDVS